mgnify:CR=1 FL=1
MGKVDRRFGTKVLVDCTFLVAKQFYEALMSVFLSVCLSFCVSPFFGNLAYNDSKGVKRG